MDSSELKSVDELLERAFQLLARREYSARELKNKFRSLASTEDIDAALVRLVELNAQSDERYAEMLCRARFNAGKGPVRIRHDLEEQGIDATVIEESMAQYADQWQALADDVRLRKFGESPPQNFREWTRQARFLQQRGFTSEHIGYFEKQTDQN